MLETYFSVTKMLGRLRSGPSGPYLNGFAAALKRQGYSPATAVRYLRAAAHLGHVMAEHGLANIDVAAFGDHLRTCRCSRASGGRRNHHTIFGARLFRQYLVEAIPHRMARLLWLLPDPTGAYELGSVDLPKTTHVSLAAMGERAQPLQGTAPSRRISKFQAAVAAGSPTGFWRMSGHPAVQHALRNHYFESLGLPRLHVPAQA